MAFLGPESVWAAAASECASDQGKFWEYHDALFTHTAGRNAGVFTRARLKEYAADLGLERGTFDSCVDSGRYEPWVQAQTDLGRGLGVTSTPTLLVNGQRVSPVPAFDALRELIVNKPAATSQQNAI
jgi:protein-disulfide isomerase